MTEPQPLIYSNPGSKKVDYATPPSGFPPLDYTTHQTLQRRRWLTALSPLPLLIAGFEWFWVRQTLLYFWYNVCGDREMNRAENNTFNVIIFLPLLCGIALALAAVRFGRSNFATQLAWPGAIACCLWIVFLSYQYAPWHV